jgi:hypothetical protein
VLAIAVLGIVMVKAFGADLDQSLAKFSLPPEVIENIRSKEIELAGLDLPQGLDANVIEELRSAICRAFISGFRLVQFFGVGLSIASALVAWRMIVPAGAAQGRATTVT